MGHSCCKPPAEESIDDVVRQLEAGLPEESARVALSESVIEAARGALAAGSAVTQGYDRRVAILGALTLASRRAGRLELAPAELADIVGVDPDRVAAADATLARELGPTAAPEAIESIRRTLIVATELRSAAERDRLRGFELPGSHLADAAPELVARTSRPYSHRDELTDVGLTTDELRAHVERLEADLELARLGTTLYAQVHGED